MTTPHSPARRIASGMTVLALAAVAFGAAPLAASAGESQAELVSAPPTVTRLYGENRYATAAAISASTFAHDGSVDYVYIATGENYADALSAGAAAAYRGGPLLLVKQNAIPGEIAAELSALSPGAIVVVGGTAAISQSVYTALDAYTDNLSRSFGPDRYSTSMAINDDAFGTTFYAWVATGENYPDALSASAAAASDGAPVVLVPGTSTTLPPAIKTFLQTELQVHDLKVAGGPATITPQLLAALDAIPSVVVERLSGATRYETSVAINQEAFGNSSTNYAFLATGTGFADALAGGAAAAHRNAPLYSVQPTCVPAGTLADITRIGASNVVLLGGPNALSAGVAALQSC